jgi:hypothetical protein
MACLAAIWLPYGFSMGGILEEWDLLSIQQKYPGLWSCFPGQPYDEVFVVRPLTVVPCAISTWLSDNSFLGFHILLLLASGMKVLAGVAIGRFLFRNTAFALCFGLLFLVYPADTQQISLRNLHHNLSNGLALVASVSFVKGYLSPRTLRRAIFLGISAFLFVLSDWIYEFSLVFYAIPAALILMRFGFFRTWRTLLKKKKTVLLWLAAPIFSVAYILLAMRVVPKSYQADLAPNGVLSGILENSKYLIHSGLYRTFYEGWIDSFAIIFTQLKNPSIFLSFLLVLIAAMFFLSKETTSTCKNAFSPIRYVTFGFALSVMGYVLSIVAVSHAVITQRTFLYVVPGAVIVLTSLLFFFIRFSKPAVLTILVGLVCSGLVSQNYQHFRYTEFYTQSIGPYLNYVASTADPNKKIHIVLDHSGNSPYLNGLYTSKVTHGPSVILHKPNDIFLLCKDSPLTKLAPFHRYTIRNGKVTVSASGVEDRVFEEKDVDVIVIPKTPLPEVIGKPLWNDLNTYNRRWLPFHDPHLVDGLYTFTADSMWGYSDFPRGDGWSDGIGRVPPTQQESVVPATADSASLLVDLGQVQNTDYLFRLYSNGSIPGQIKRGLTASLNGKPLQLEFVGHQYAVIQSLISKGRVRDGVNELSFSGVMPTEGCSLTMRKLLLGPEERVLQEDGVAGAGPFLEMGCWYKSDRGTIWPYLYSGFSGNEPNGTWTDGTQAVIRFNSNPLEKIKRIHLGGMAFLCPAHQRFEMIVSLNGQRIGREVVEEKGMKVLNLSYDVPSALLDVNSGDNQVVLSIPNPATPKEVGAGERFLGFFLNAFMVDGSVPSESP